MLRTKNLNLLPILLALLEEESVVAAARRVHLSQPAVSSALAKLRVEYDDPLLVRVGRGMRLTTRAMHLLPLVKQSCAELERLFDLGVFDPALSTEQFEVAAPDHLSFLMTRELLPILDAEAPGIRIRFAEPPNDLPRHLDEGSVDLAIAANFDVWHGVEYQPLFQERFLAAMSVDHPLARCREITQSQVDRYTRVARTSRRSMPGGDGSVLTGMPIFDRDPHVSLEQFAEAALLVVGTDLLVPAPEMLIDRLAQLVPIIGIPFAPDISTDAGMFWASFRTEAPEILWLRSVVERCFSDNGLASPWRAGPVV